MATNDFLTFAGDPAADVLPQSQYLASSFTARLLGFSTGTALSIQLNKVWRQASLISHMIGQFTIDEVNQDMLDDGTPAGLTALETHFRAAITHVAQSAVGTGYLPLTGGALSGLLTINASPLAINAPADQSVAINLSRQSSHTAALLGYTGTFSRWAVLVGDSAPEQGGNSGSNFAIYSYADGGGPNALDIPLSINRATGVVNFSHSPTVNGANLPYVRMTGDVMSGPLGVGSLGISYNGLGGYWAAHHIAFGWDGTWVNMAVDGTFIGSIATTAWANSLVGNYLPLGGGVLTGQLDVHAQIIAGGTLWARSTVVFGNLADFANFTDGRYRYRQWAGSWYEAWDGQTGLRAWAAPGAWIMTLDGTGSLYVRNTLKADGSRIISASGLNGGSVAPSVCCYWTSGVAKGMWVDASGLWLGQMDGAGNPTRADMLYDNNGYLTIYGILQVNSNFTCYGGQGWFAGVLITNSNFSAAGTGYFGNWVTMASSLQVNGNINCNNTVNGAVVSSNGYLWANDRLMVKSGYPAICSWNPVAGGAGGFWALSDHLGFTGMDGNGNPTSYMATMTYSGWLYMAGGLGGISDAKVKHDIKPSSAFDSLAAIRALVSRAFNWNFNNAHQPFGLIASEVAPHLPDVVRNHDNTDYLDLTALLVHALRAIQQLADRIEGARA
jgi:hypothetical protein